MNRIPDLIPFCPVTRCIIFPRLLGLQIAASSAALVMKHQEPEICANAAESGLELLDRIQLEGSDAALPSFSLWSRSLRLPLVYDLPDISLICFFLPACSFCLTFSPRNAALKAAQIVSLQENLRGIRWCLGGCGLIISSGVWWHRHPGHMSLHGICSGLVQSGLPACRFILWQSLEGISVYQ